MASSTSHEIFVESPRSNETRSRESPGLQRHRIIDVVLNLCYKLDMVLCCGLHVCVRFMKPCCRLRQSIFTRMSYIGLLFGACLLCGSLLTPRTRYNLGDNFCQNVSYYFCDILFSYAAVYRVLFLLAIYYFLQSLLLFGVCFKIVLFFKFHQAKSRELYRKCGAYTEIFQLSAFICNNSFLNYFLVIKICKIQSQFSWLKCLS